MAETRVLNEDQQRAITHGDGPLLIIAGAGTGKTTVVTQRIQYLILEKKNSPENIVALTFTEKAAREMEERIDVIMPYGYTQMWIATFHSFCDQILRNEAVHIGLSPIYHLATEAETILFLRKNLFKFALEYFRPLGNPTKFLQGMIQHFSRLKDEDITPADYLMFAKTLEKRGDVEDDEKKKTWELARAYKTYEELKITEGIMDFSDLISHTLSLFRTRKNILKEYQDKFQYILVDEFQDTNFAQNELAILLSGERKNITVVGDDDQAIYRWRGAALANMMQFKSHFPQSKIISLTKNYRSTQTILDHAYHLIQYNNPDRLEIKENMSKKLLAMRTTTGAPCKFILADRVENEAEYVVKKIQELVENKTYSYNDIAILVRANDYAHPFSKALERAGIPYQFLGPGQLFHQPEIKELISYLRVLANYEDSVSLYRVLCMKIFALDPKDIATLMNLSKRKNYSLFEALEHTNEALLSEKGKKTVQTIVAMIKRHLERAPKDSAGQILYYFLEDTGLLMTISQARSLLEEKRTQNIARFFEKLKTYEAEHEDASVFVVVDWIDLSMQVGESPLAADVDWTNTNAVNILTIHASKGLEFTVVFIVNLVNQRFPTRQRREQIPIPQELIKETLPEGDFHLQEERRLFYVAMTRARNSLYLTASLYYGEGKRERKISPFVTEALGETAVAKSIKQYATRQTANQLSLLEWKSTDSKRKEAAPLVPYQHETKRLTYLSYSQIQTFDICPLHFKLRYILKIPTLMTASLSFGTSVHAVLRDFYLAKRSNTPLSLKSLPTLLAKNWINEGFQSKSHERTAKERALTIISNYLEKQDSGGEGETVAVEMPFLFPIHNPHHPKELLKIGGRIDRVRRRSNDTLEIIDYKTGSTLPDEKQLNSDLQLTTYALAATHVHDKIFGNKPSEILLSLHYLEKDTMVTTQRTKEQLEEAKILLFQKAEEIAQSSYLCSGISLCQTCEYKMICTTTAQ